MTTRLPTSGGYWLTFISRTIRLRAASSRRIIPTQGLTWSTCDLRFFRQPCSLSQVHYSTFVLVCQVKILFTSLTQSTCDFQLFRFSASLFLPEPVSCSACILIIAGGCRFVKLRFCYKSYTVNLRPLTFSLFR